MLWSLEVISSRLKQRRGVDRLSEDVPTEALAERIAAEVTGERPAGVSRFATGLQHYVFEVTFTNRPAVVVRLTLPRNADLMRSASRLSHQLRPLGVPLPRILAEGLDTALPHLVLERLPGIDLGRVVGTLTEAQLDAIAGKVAEAQRVTASTPSARLYGYAPTPQEAPFTTWSAVLGKHLARSRSRIADAGIFGLEQVERAEAILADLTSAADAQPATPFLHDTTTKNVLVTPEGSFSGIVDVDDLCFGDPRYTIALTRAALDVSGGPARYTDTWLRLAGFPGDRLFRFYVALFFLDFMGEQGLAFNGNQPSRSRAHEDQLQQLCSETLRGVASRDDQ
jgi:aminoglycoside phosphotransferase (APT) family kinase protein